MGAWSFCLYEPWEFWESDKSDHSWVLRDLEVWDYGTYGLDIVLDTHLTWIFLLHITLLLLSPCPWAAFFLLYRTIYHRSLLLRLNTTFCRLHILQP